MSFLPQSYISALLAKTICRDDEVFDAGMNSPAAGCATYKSLSFFFLQMTNPAIQNDFSYYRRTLSRMRINNVPVSTFYSSASSY